MLESLSLTPEIKLVKRAKILKNQEYCPISLEPLDDTNSSVTYCCRRTFITTNLLQWATIDNSNTCPNCRSEINIDDLLQDQLNIKNFKSALQIADTITNEKIKSLALLDISQFYLKNGNHEEALKIAASIPLKDTKRDALNEIWNFLVKDGNTKKIVDLLTITLPTMDNDSAKTDLILGVKYRLSDEQFMGLINMTFPTLNNDSAKIKLILGVKDKLSSDQLFELIANFIKKGRGLGLEDKLHDLFFDVKDSLSPTHLINFIEMTIIINYAPINEGHYKNQIIVAVKDKISNDQLFKLMKMTIPTLYKQKSMYMVSMFYWVKGKLSNDQIIDLIINNKRDCTGDDIIACIKQTHTPMNVQQKKTLIEGVKDKLSEEEITLINNLQK